MIAQQLSLEQVAKPTGVAFGIDWYAFTLKDMGKANTVALLKESWGEEWGAWECRRSGDRWERLRGAYGSLMEVNYRDRWVHVQIKGKGCRRVGVPKVLSLHDVLAAKLGGAYRPKRVDMAWDDYEKRVSVEEFRARFWDREAKCLRPGVRTRVKESVARQNDSVAGGGSYVVGSRSSERMLRVYDKAAQSGGAVNAIRFELECKERMAVEAMRLMSASSENPGSAGVRLLVGLVDFRCASEGEPGKGRRQAWWHSLVGDAKLASPAPVERSGLFEWVGHFASQTASGFALLTKICGSAEKAAQVLLSANKRDNPRHAAWAAEVKSGAIPIGLGDVRGIVLGEVAGGV